MGTFGQHCRRLPLLLWKNWILRKRHWVVTTLQVLLPVILVMGFSYLNYSLTSGNEGVKEKGQMHIASKMGLIEYAVGELNYTRVAYVPSNDFTDKVIKSVDDSIKRYYPDTIIDWKGFATEASVEKIVQPQFLVPGIRTTPTDDISAAIIFKKQFNNVGSIPSKGIYSYTLRFVKDSANTRELFPAEQKITGQYEITGFTGLQLLLDQVITNELTSTELNESFVFMTMPAYGQDSVFMGILPLILVLSFILIVPTVVREIVSERQSGIKELMRIMGLPNWMHLLGWLIDSIIFLSITVTLVTFLLYFKFSSNSSAVITHGDASLGWVVIFIYCMTSVAMCIFIASFFEQPALATTLGLLVWVLTYFGLALIVDRQYHSLNIWLVAFLCFIPNLGCSLCLRNIREFESTGVGAGWKNVYETASVFKHEWLSVGHILVIMFVSMVFFLLLAMYVENIMPFTFGVRKPWYYIFTSSCVRKPKIIDSDELGSKAGEEETHGEYFESEPTHISPGVEILHLAKEFGNGKIAVNNLSLNIFKGQITALLGHNGAGKTTTMSILTGIISPTRGTALIDGHNIRSDMEGARQNMGLCPQQNMLFDRLTVKEHLLFFAKLKGTNRGRANLEIEGFLNQLDMRKKMNAMSKALSGGQKRKLNLAMALVGGSRVVILDEPTSGMDPESRRAMWDLLMAERGRRTILLTTHLMEEADVLGDRIAIMAEGRLKCCGSPTFLKNKYGAGYTIRMTLKDKAKADKILSTVQNHVTNASFKGMPNSLELAVILPSLEDSAVFPSLFSDLESNKEKLGIQTVGLSLTTMDEIFMKVILMDQNIESAPEPPSVRNIPSKSKSVTVTESKPKVVKSLGNEQMKNASRSNIAFREESQTASLHPEVSNQGNYPRESKSEIHVHEPTKRTGSSLGKLHFYAILMKRVHYSRRNLKIVLIQLILSLVLVIWTIVACNKYRSPSIDDVDRPPLQFTLSSYSDPVTPYRDNGSIRNLGGVYAEVVGKSSVKLAASGNFHDYLKSKATEDLVKYRRSYIVGADLDNALMNVSSKMQLLYYSTLPNHALPLAANIISNTFLRLLSRNISGGDFSIDANNHPLPSRYRDMSNAFKIAKSELKGFSGFSDIFLSLISVGLAVVAAFLVIFPAEERITKAKHLQLMTGVNVFIFWGTSLLWDFFVLFVIICILLCCFPIFEVYTVFTENNAIGVLFVILVVYAFTSICFAYFVSLFVRTISNGFSFIACLNIFFGLLFSIYISVEETLFYSKRTVILGLIARICPFFGIVRSIKRFISTVAVNSRCAVLLDEFPSVDCNGTSLSSTCCDCTGGTQLEKLQRSQDGSCFQVRSFIHWWEGKFVVETGKTVKSWVDLPGIGQELVCAVIAGIFYFLLVLCIDCGFFKPLFALCHYRKPEIIMDERDVDVMEEAKRIEAQLSAGQVVSDAVVLSSVTKMFGSFPAVNNLTFGVRHGECFGLLGVNGAGKTTSFRILTGDTGPSHGNAFMGQYNIRQHSKTFLNRIGYCPQFDAILGVLSGKEMLQLFSRLRGIPNTSEETTKWLSKVGLLESANVQCRKYSGGMKRRLSTAMALIGDPPVVMLDEPTAGVDPVARRQFWGVIRSNRELGQAIILTSHSMDECEALCSRLAIMVNGQFQCFGGVQHIKSKYGQGFTLTFKLKPMVPQNSPRLLSLMVEIETHFRPCELKDRHENILQYQIYKTNLPWKNLFEILEDMKINYEEEIEDYSASETTLDEVFLSFARQQYPARDGDTGFFSCCASKKRRKNHRGE